jgi:hypothetical protein
MYVHSYREHQQVLNRQQVDTNGLPFPNRPESHRHSAGKAIIGLSGITSLINSKLRIVSWFSDVYVLRGTDDPITSPPLHASSDYCHAQNWETPSLKIYPPFPTKTGSFRDSSNRRTE